MKRFAVMLCTVLMVLFMIPATAQAAESVALKITADRAVANPGDTVDFTVWIGAVSNLGGLQFDLVIPSGLTLLDESVSLPAGLAETLDSDGEILKPRKEHPTWMYTAQDKGYTGSVDFAILTFSCAVDAAVELGEKSVSATIETCFDNSVDMNDFDVAVNSAKLTVEKKKVAVIGVSLDRNTLTLKDGETATLTATVEPSNADNKTVTWSSDNAEVATVADGTVTAVKSGAANITVATADGNKTAVCAVTVVCNHELTKHDRVEPTTCEDGSIEYYSCSKCGRYYTDAAGTAEVKAEDVRLNAAHNVAGAKWSFDGDSHWKVCADCGTKVGKARHEFKWVIDQEASSGRDGIKHEECACGAKRNENTVIKWQSEPSWGGGSNGGSSSEPGWGGGSSGGSSTGTAASQGSGSNTAATVPQQPLTAPKLPEGTDTNVITVASNAPGIIPKALSDSQVAEIRKASKSAVVISAIEKVFGSVTVNYMGTPVDIEVQSPGRVWVFFLPAPGEGYGVTNGYGMVHFKDGKLDTPEAVRLTWDQASGTYYADLQSGSPYYIFQWVSGADNAQTGGAAISPKTGEVLPVVLILAVFCATGAAVCGKKVRRNK